MERKLKENIEWFEQWFDSPYYHILYKNRDLSEAKEFITKLIKHLNPLKSNLFLDVACGKGRHAVYLNQLGYTVDGFDLSKNSIEIAKKLENNSLRFYTNDIRNPLKLNQYNYAFNLFTSFGYFRDENDNQLAIKSIADSLKENGILVLDFLNSNKVINSIGSDETKTIDGITFNIQKSVKNGFIIKHINFSDKGIKFNFQETVKAISLNNFKSYFDNANLKLDAIFGDYNLNSFDLKNSDRLILIVRKQ